MPAAVVVAAAVDIASDPADRTAVADRTEGNRLAAHTLVDHIVGNRHIPADHTADNHCTAVRNHTADTADPG